MRVALVIGWDETIVVNSAVLAKVPDFFLPRRLVRVPDEPLLFQDLGSLKSHCRRLAFLDQLVLPALTLHPSRELWIGGVSMRNEHVSMFFAKI